MPYNKTLASKIETILNDYPDFSSKKMFGGICFIIKGHMCCGVVDDKVMLRIGLEDFDQALESPGIARMDFTGKPMRGFVYLEKPFWKDKETLQFWIQNALNFVLSLPSKKPRN